MPRFLLSFEDFHVGEYGGLGAVHAPPGSFTGTNVERYMDGSIGPRPGLKNVSPASGLPAGKVLGFDYTGVTGNSHFAIVGNTVYGWDAENATPSAVTAYAGTFGVTPTTPVPHVLDANGIGYASIYGERTYKLDHGAKTVTLLAGSPGGRCLTRYGRRLVVSGGTGTANRVYYSGSATDPGDTTVWGASSYLDVGDAWPVTALYTQLNRLVIAKQNSWWVLTGVLGSSDVLRQLYGPTVAFQLQAEHGTLLADNKIWFVPWGASYPAALVGGSVSPSPHLDFAGGNYSVAALPPAFGAAPLRYPDDVVLIGSPGGTGGSNVGITQRLGTWSKHSFGVTVAGWCAQGLSRQAVIISDGGGVATVAKFYAWRVGDLERPPISGNLMESLGDASNTPPACSFTLPEWWAAASRHRGRYDRIDVKVVAVVVDFKKWNHGYAASNAYTLTVTPIRVDGGNGVAGGDGTAKTASWSEAASVSSATGTTDRQKHTFNPAFANGFQLAFSGLVGVAVQKIHVEIEILPAEGI